MYLRVAARLAVLLVCAAAGGCREELAIHRQRVPIEHTLVGQLLLPPGTGSRGVEVLVRTAPRGGESPTTWVVFDEQGHFSHPFRETVTTVTVTAGSEVYRVDARGLPEVNGRGQIDMGLIDLRDRLMRHRIMVRAPHGKLQGDVRVAMFSGPPPVGPFGEPVSLGSSQFPQIALNSEMEWLVPQREQGIYFLAERPVGSGRGLDWRSGQQSLFGPFSSADLPNELVVE